MSIDIKIDYEKISTIIQYEIERWNQAVLEKNPNSDINFINQSAGIAEIVCITAIKAYHEELCQALASLPYNSQE